MAVTIINLEAVPEDLAPGMYCCRLDESSSLAEFRARFVSPPRVHVPGDCLIQLIKEAPSCRTCNDTGIVQCVEHDGEGAYEQACPERVHDGQPSPFAALDGGNEEPF